MKKTSLIILLLISLLEVSAQGPVVLKFSGRNEQGGYVRMSNVLVENQTKRWQEVLYYPDTILNLNVLGVDDYTQNGDVQIFQNIPNPFEGVTDFSLRLKKEQKVQIAIYDIKGSLLTQYNKKLPEGMHQFRATLTTPQTYLLSAKTLNGKLSIKMVNIGNGGENLIEYVGVMDEMQTSMDAGNKGGNTLPFTNGDWMKYVGYAVFGGKQYQSTPIVKSQTQSETIYLSFQCLPTIYTTTPFNITSTTAQSGGNVTEDGGTTVTARGICWSTMQNPTKDNHYCIVSGSTGAFSANMTNLTPGTTYYVRAYATNSAGTAYGEQKSFTTLAALPTVTTASTSNITTTTAASGGNVTSSGGANVTAKGVCWSTSSNPTISGNHTTDGSGTGSFTSSMTNLNPGTTYYVRAYATNSAGTAYGEQKNFTTLATFPTVTTTTPSNVTSTSATSGGNVTSDGGPNVTVRGVCWSTSSNPTISDNHTTDGSGTGSFTSSMTNLSPGTTYYVRAYATNSKGTTYGEQKSFTTSATLPTMTTASVTNITATTATGGGNVTSTGGAAVTARGICWSTSANPTISGNHTTDGSGMGSFTSSMTNLSPNTTYYVRAYATNSAGTAYGELKNFTTLAAFPTVTTTTPSNVTSTSATSGGNVTSDGGATVTARGICWSTSTNPTISGNHTTDGSGTGSFTSSMTNLNPGTTYYVRAYATNSAGTAYGEQKNFTTLATFPTVTTTTPSNVTSTSATSGGNVTSDGGVTVTARGVCWNTSSNPTISGNHTTDGSGTGSFTSSMTNLSPGTTYYVRAYATNSKGTAYGEQKSFTTSEIKDGKPCLGAATVKDYDGNTYNTVQIGNQCWMKENLKTTHYSDGTSIPLGSSMSTSKAYRYYPDDNSSNVSTYGYLYNWPAVMRNSSSSSTNPSKVQGICPRGWHVPSDAEWTQLTDYVGGQNEYVCGGYNTNIAKSLASTMGWNSGNGTCTVGKDPSTNNATGFSAVPAGFYFGSYYFFGSLAYFWSATQYNSDSAYFRYLLYSFAFVTRYYSNKDYGLSVRCLKDEEQFTCGTSTVSDHEGNVYNTVQIGNQCWTKENMRCKTSPSTGTTILETSPNSYSYTGKKAYYVNGIFFNTSTYGLLYNWNAAVDTFNTAYGETSTNANSDYAVSVTFSGNRRGICPEGWHIPNNAEWTQLENYVGSQREYQCDGSKDNIAKALASTTGWNSDNGTCTVGNNPSTNNATGFSAVPVGSYYGYYSDFGYYAHFWSVTRYNSIAAYYRGLYHDIAYVGGSYLDKTNGFSVRCVRDKEESFTCGTSTVTDHEGNVYNTVKIGNQCWTKENMRCKTSPSTGTTILEVNPSSASYTGKKAYYVNGSSSNTSTYGLLYNWNAAVDTFNTAYGETSTNANSDYAVSVTFSGNRRGICPKGWHVPSDGEWTQLKDNVRSQSEYQCGGNNTYIAKALASTTGWNSDNGNGACTVGNNPSTNNATGFSAVPAGSYYGYYNIFGNYAYFWSATQNNSYYAYYRSLDYDNANVYRGYYNKIGGFSVRCVRDEEETFTCGKPINDIDGNSYNTVLIGEQCWMKENIRSTTYADGTPLTGGFAKYDVSDKNVGTDTLVYYSWAVATKNSTNSDIHNNKVQGICPTGWHVPCYDDWNALCKTADPSFQDVTNRGSSNQEIKSENGLSIKLCAPIGWPVSTTPNTPGYYTTDPTGFNTTGFSALPTGYAKNDGTVFAPGSCHFWASVEGSSQGDAFKIVAAGTGITWQWNMNAQTYCGVRCVMDSENGGGEIDDPVDTISLDGKHVIFSEQEGVSYQIYDITNPDKAVWEWSPRTNGGYSTFNNPSDVKPAYNGTCIMAVASGGGAVIVRLKDKKVLFYANPAGNPHSIELLPNNRVVVASSTGNKLTVYNIDTTRNMKTPATAVYTMPFDCGHNVVWDEGRKCLWSAGQSYVEKIAYDEATGKLTSVEKYKFPEGNTYAHDFIKIYGKDLYHMSTEQHTFIFDPNNNTFTLCETPASVNVKSISSGPEDYPTICAIPMAGYGTANRTWVTNKVLDFNTGKTLMEIPGSEIYKLRWWIWEK